MNTKTQYLTENVQRVFQILVEHPEGLSSKALWERLASLQKAENGNGNSHRGVPSFEELSFACIGPIKAGWLEVAGNRWTVSQEGREAYENHASHGQLISEAGKRSTQGWLAINFPRAYSTAAKTKDRVSSEMKTIRRIGISRLITDSLTGPRKWQEVLPIQRPRSINLADFAAPGLIDYLQSAGAPFGEGSHAVYLSPQIARRTVFGSILDDYPSNAGLKIMKNEGTVSGSNYIVGRAKGDSAIQLGSVHSHPLLTLVANLLYAKGVGPRLYDLLNIQSGQRQWTAYVVEDVGQRQPTLTECEKGIEILRSLDAEGLLRVILPLGFDDEEFECPTCCNNALIDDKGNFKYIDFQNFLLGNYEDFLKNLALEASSDTHFGDTTVVRGGRYLYQSIPGVKLPAKRSVANRMKTITDLLQRAGVSVEERVVLDVGCNIGMMMGEYLKMGAKWCHGWDRASTVRHTERILLALGCTRFSTTGTDITQAQPLANDVPPHVGRSLDGCVISYLAIRGHLDWLDALGSIPWSFMIYEGHEGESSRDLEVYLNELKRLANFKLGPTATYVDGDSDERTVAILLKN